MQSGVMRYTNILLALSGLCLSHGASAAAQDPLDRTDAAIIEEEFQFPRDIVDDVNLPDIPRPQTQLTDVEGGVFVGAIRVENSQLPASRFVPVIEQYVGRTLSPGDLQQLSTAIAGILRDEGHIFANAWIAPQHLETGMLRVSVDEGRISEIRNIGASNSAVTRILEPLADGEPVTADRLERRLILAGDVPGIRITGTQFFRQDDRGILQVTVEYDRVSGWARLSNDGSESVGPWRLQGGIIVNGAVIDGDRLRVSTSATPFEPGDFGLIRVAYGVPLGDDGTTVGFNGYYARSNPDNGVLTNDRDGDSIGVSITLRHPLVRTRNASLWATTSLRYRKTMQDNDGVPIREDRVTTAEIGLNGYVRLGRSHLSGGGQIVQGLGIFNASREGDALTSRFDGSGRFTKFSLYGRLWTPLGSNFSIQLTGRAQLATRALLAGDEMGVGGPHYGRGYDYYERSGENGVAGVLEVRYDIENIYSAIENIQLYSFVDGAGVRNLGNGNGGGRLASVGGGVRVRLTNNINLDLAAGVPLNADRFDSDNRSPRIRFGLGVNF